MRGWSKVYSNHIYHTLPPPFQCSGRGGWGIVYSYHYTYLLLLTIHDSGRGGWRIVYFNHYTHSLLLSNRGTGRGVWRIVYSYQNTLFYLLFESILISFFWISEGWGPGNIDYIFLKWKHLTFIFYSSHFPRRGVRGTL